MGGRGHNYGLNYTDYNINNKLVSAGADASLKFWDVSLDPQQNTHGNVQPQFRSTPGAHMKSITAVAFAKSDATRMVSVGKDGVLCIWKVNYGDNLLGDLAGPSGGEEVQDDFGVRGGGRVGTPANRNSSPNSSPKSAQGKSMMRVSGVSPGNSPTGSQHVNFNHEPEPANIETGYCQIKARISAHVGSIYGVDIHPIKSNIIMTIGDDCTLRMWNVNDLSKDVAARSLKLQRGFALEHFAIPARNECCWAVKFSPNGKLLATVSSDMHVMVWEVLDSKNVSMHGMWKAHDAWIR